jgi:deoxyhypusine synthase
LQIHHEFKLGGFIDGQVRRLCFENVVADLVARNVDVIVAKQGSAAAVMAANKTIPFEGSHVQEISAPAASEQARRSMVETIISSGSQLPSGSRQAFAKFLRYNLAVIL